MRVHTLRPQFVELMPKQLESGVLYVSMTYGTAIHLCCCGCGHRVVTPLAPDEWQLSFDGVAVWLDPSIGNWSFPCQSHYWIRGNSVEWARRWTQEEIRLGRARDRAQKTASATDRETESPPSIWQKLLRLFS